MSLQAVPVCLVTMLCVLLGIDFGALAVLIGAVTGSRGAAVGLASTIAAAAYLISSLAPVVPWLHPARFASPFFYAVGDGQLTDGLSVPDAAVLLAVAAALTGACLAAFDHLDVH